MKTYSQLDMEQKEIYFLTIILPLLVKFGHDTQKMISLFKNGYVRLRWGMDWNNFTVHLTNPLNEPTCIIDNIVHSIWNGIYTPNTLVMSCFIGDNKISSLALTDLYTLAEGLRKYGKKQQIRNRINSQTFATLPFSHKSLSKNMWGIGIK